MGRKRLVNSSRLKVNNSDDTGDKFKSLEFVFTTVSVYDY